MLSSMLKKIQREEENLVHGYKQPMVSPRSNTRLGEEDPVQPDPLFDVALNDTPSLHYHSVETSSYSRFQKGRCIKGPKTVSASYRYRSPGTKRVDFADTPTPTTTFSSHSNNNTPGHKVMTPAYTPRYFHTPLTTHHKVMTPAYTPRNDFHPAEAETNPGSRSSHTKKTPMYKPRYGNMKKTVMYTPKYDPMYFDSGNCSSECDDNSNSIFFVASPTTPKYTPTSPAFLELVGHEDEVATRGWAFSPCYNPAEN